MENHSKRLVFGQAMRRHGKNYQPTEGADFVDATFAKGAFFVGAHMLEAW